MTVIPLLAYGLAVGLSLGLTGGGGSIITVPLLVYLVGQPVHVAIPTSLAIVGGTALAGYLTRASAADSRAGVIIGLVGLVGAIPGRYAALLFDGQALLALFSIIMLIAAFFMFRSTAYQAPKNARPNWLAAAAGGVGIGFLTGFLGVGGGFLIVPCLVLVLGMSMRQAVPTSLLVIAINCAWGLVGHLLAAGHGAHGSAAIDWRLAALFLAGGLAGSWAGGAVAAALDQRALKRIFAVFVFAVGLFMTATTTGLLHVPVK